MVFGNIPWTDFAVGGIGVAFGLGFVPGLLSRFLPVSGMFLQFAVVLAGLLGYSFADGHNLVKLAFAGVTLGGIGALVLGLLGPILGGKKQAAMA